LIEGLLEEHGIAVVWDNESVKSRRARARRALGEQVSAADGA
jgi:hypothetical protein